MKFQITKAEFDKLSEDLQKLYGPENDGNHTMAINGLPDTTELDGLKAKVDQLLTEKKDEAKKRKKAEKDAAEAARKKAENDGDIEALKTSWQQKYDTDIAAEQAKTEDVTKLLHNEKVHSKAVEMATTLAVPGSADVLLPHIQNRLKMDITDDGVNVVVLDQTGKPSALTVEDLQKEIASNKAFAPLIVASNASGGGANGSGNGGAGSGNKASGDMSHKEKSAFITEHGLSAWEQKIQAEA